MLPNTSVAWRCMFDAGGDGVLKSGTASARATQFLVNTCVSVEGILIVLGPHGALKLTACLQQHSVLRFKWPLDVTGHEEIDIYKFQRAWGGAFLFPSARNTPYPWSCGKRACGPLVPE